MVVRGARWICFGGQGRILGARYHLKAAVDFPIDFCSDLDPHVFCSPNLDFLDFSLHFLDFFSLQLINSSSGTDGCMESFRAGIFDAAPSYLVFPDLGLGKKEGTRPSRTSRGLQQASSRGRRSQGGGTREVNVDFLGHRVFSILIP